MQKMRFLVLLFGILFLSERPGPAQEPTASAVNYFEQAKQAKTDDEKIRFLELAVAADPGYYDALATLGQLYLQNGQATKAAEYLAKAVLKNSQSSTLELWGDALVKSGKAVDARSAYETAFKRDSKNSNAFFKMIELLLQEKQFDLAKQKIRENFAKLGTTNPDALFYLGEISSRKGEREEAREAYQATLKYKPDHKKAQQAINRIDNELKIVTFESDLKNALDGNDLELGLRKIDEIKKIDANYAGLTKWYSRIAEIYMSQGDAALQQSDQATALKNYNLAASYDQNLPGLDQKIHQLEQMMGQEEILATAFNSGNRALQEKKWEEAVRHLRQVVRLDPNYRNAQALLFQAQQEQAKLRPTEPNTQVLSELESQSADRHYRAGVKYCLQSQWGLAISQFDSALTIDPDFLTAKALKKYASGAAAIDRKEWAQALSSLDSAQNLAPADSMIWIAKSYAQGQQYLAQQRLSEALAAFEVIEKSGVTYRDTPQQLQIIRGNLGLEGESWRSLLPYLVAVLLVFIVILIILNRKKTRVVQKLPQPTPAIHEGATSKAKRNSEEVPTLVKDKKIEAIEKGESIMEDLVDEEEWIQIDDEQENQETRVMGTPSTRRRRTGRYEMRGQIGKGAMGNVYKAYDHKMERIIVLKEIRMDADLEPEEYDKLKKRFVREARSAGRLYHPNIVTVFDIINQGNKLYISMEFLDGVNLLKLLGEQRIILPKKAADIVRQACSALHYAHQEGIVHRDIKPSNIMLLKTEQVKIVDFGVAKVSDSSTLTQVGSSLGTPSYMSPEQIEGKDVDGRSDIFSLGVLFYEMVTGERPFRGENLASIIVKIIQAQPKRVTEIRKELPPELEKIIIKMLEKKPEKRYQTAFHVIEDINRVYDRL